VERVNIDKIVKTKKVEEVKVRKSKTFHRCSSCKLIGSTENKENCEKIKERGKVIVKKVKTLSLLEVQRKSFLQKGKSPTRKSNITSKYMLLLDAKKTKKL
jgi:endo-1,4-beta-mannosidase